MSTELELFIAEIKKHAEAFAYSCSCNDLDESHWELLCDTLATLTDVPNALRERSLAKDAARYRWLRRQHEGQDDLSFDADGLPMPIEPTALAFTVFMPDASARESLVPVGCMPGELNETIDAAMKAEKP